MASPARAFDLVVWGGSGFTGRLACEYLARRYTTGSKSASSVAHTEPVRWAIAGRDKAKLEKVRDAIVEKHPHAKDKITVLTATIDDPLSMERLVSQTNTVLTFAGPFAKYGMPVVDACVKMGTDYCDITGEPTFIRNVVDKHQMNLESSDYTNAPCIVNCVGYDSVPFDLGAWGVTKYLKQKHNTPCVEAFGHVGKSKGGASGGTFASVLHLMQSTPMSVLKKMASPHFLTADGPPDDVETKKRWATQSGPRYDSDLKRWTMASVMAGINTKVVARSAELEPGIFDFSKFAYNEDTPCKSRWNAFVGTAVVGFFGGLLLFPPTRWLLAKYVLPKPGEAPDENMRESGYANVYVVGTGDGKGDSKKAVAHMSFRDADPGYKGTAALAVEAALCLALPTERVKTPGALRGGGVLTPSSAMGQVLVDRINKSENLQFSVGELAGAELRV